jgi:hypothetical protein
MCRVVDNQDGIQIVRWKDRSWVNRADHGQTWPSRLENSKLGSARSFRSESSQDSEIRAEQRAPIEILVRLASRVESRR